MRARVLIGLALALVATALVGWNVLRPRRPSLHPGRVEVVLLDSLGKPWPESASVRLGKQTFVIGPGGRAGPFDVEWGPLHVDVRPSPRGGCGTVSPYENGLFELEVTGSESPDLQVFELTLGPTLIDVTRARVDQVLREREATREVTVQLLWPDGGPAAEVAAACRDRLVSSDSAGLVECGTFLGTVAFSAGQGTLGARGEVADTLSDATFVLAPSLQLALQFQLPDGGPVPPTASPVERELTLNSRDLMHAAFPTGDRFFVGGVPPSRTIVCLRDKSGAACEVVSADGGAEVSLTLVPDRPGTIVFDVADSPPLVVYLDRAMRAVADGGHQSFAVEPGAHVLVLNTKRGPERYEAVVRVGAGQTLELGTLELK